MEFYNYGCYEEKFFKKAQSKIDPEVRFFFQIHAPAGATVSRLFELIHVLLRLNKGINGRNNVWIYEKRKVAYGIMS